MYTPPQSISRPQNGHATSVSIPRGRGHRRRGTAWLRPRSVRGSRLLAGQLSVRSAGRIAGTERSGSSQGCSPDRAVITAATESHPMGATGPSTPGEYPIVYPQARMYGVEGGRLFVAELETSPTCSAPDRAGEPMDQKVGGPSPSERASH
jgi:hypothetical protein